jgi:CHAT domain-containing protein
MKEAESFEAQGTAAALKLALGKYRQALEIYRSLGNRKAEATSLYRLGGVYRLLNERQKAIEVYNLALAITRELGERQAEARLVLNLGLLYRELGDYTKSLDFLNQTLGLAREIKDRNVEARALNNLGILSYTRQQLSKALEFYDGALALAQASGERTVESDTLNNMGLVHFESGNYDKALDCYNRSLALIRDANDKRAEIYTLNNIALIYNAKGQTARAMELYRQSLPVFRALGDRQGEFKALAFIACAANTLGRFEEARATLSEALEIVESLRARITRQELRESYLASMQYAYEDYIDLLMQLNLEHFGKGFDGLALQVNEQRRARSLQERLFEAYANIREGVDPALLKRGQSLQQMLNERAKRQAQLSNGKSSEALAAINQEIESLTGQYLEVEAEIRATSPRYAALTQPQPLSLKEIQQQLLDANTLLLEYSLGEKQSFLWVVSQTSITTAQLPSRAVIETAARNFYELARADAESNKVWKAASRLSQMILAPVANRLGNHRLLIVADGALHYVPFAALPQPEGRESGVESLESKKNPDSGRQTPDSRLPLIMGHEIVSLPSASTLAVLRRELSARTPAPKTLAVLADPVFTGDDVRVKQARAGAPDVANDDQQTMAQQLIRSAEESGLMKDGTRLPRLIGTRREATAILSLVKDDQRKQALDFDASRATAVHRELGDYRIIHFATHGLLNSVHPELSGLVLSLTDRQGQAQDGFLRLHEIYNLKLPAELIVLSACQTGLGKEVRGEGLIGLTRGFMYAGAPRVVASLWKVDDKATAELMRVFYQGMLGEHPLPPAQALRAAQIAVWKQKVWRSPYYWAAFVLQGEWK